MVAMRMGHENVLDTLALQGVEQRGEMRGGIRSGVDDRDVARADHISASAGEGHRARIVSGNAPYQRRESDEFIRDAGRPQIERDFRIGAAHSGVTLVLPALSR